MMRSKQILCFLFLLLPIISFAAGKPFTILHTNDWQSRLLGFGPNAEYSPGTLNDDLTIGGVARLATKIEQLRRSHTDEATLLLDGGDISQGTLFHTLYRTHAPELRLMKLLGYDAITLGNHEFDFRPNGLSRMLESASRYIDQLPPIIASNLTLPPAQKHLQDQGVIESWKIIEKNGIRFGLFGLMGQDANQSAPEAKPAVFEDQLATARTMVKLLREKQKADVVILLSHSGIVRNKDGSWGGEEVEYARQVPGIDVIVGGHSHTVLFEALTVNDTQIVQAGSEMRYLGELALELTDTGKVKLRSYKLHPIDDSIPGSPIVSRQVSDFKRIITEEVLSPLGYTFDQPLVQTPRTLDRVFGNPVLGNLVADAIRKAAGSDIALTTNGVIRGDILKGETGIQTVSDIFRLEPLGVGKLDDEPGYPLVKVWMNAKELRNMMEILVLAYQVYGKSYFPRVSGLRVTYNEYRPPLDRVASIELGDPINGFTSLNLNDTDKLYSFAASSYIGSYAWIVGDISHGLLEVNPKDANGNILDDLDKAIIDRDLQLPGIQEYKMWQVQLDYFSQLPDKNNDDIADISLDENITTPRMVTNNSLHPNLLFQNATWIMWTVVAVLFTLLLIILSIFNRLLRALLNRKQP
ncbi:5'-nucleotidase C-terminal domain-containing protein [Sansalvadorimonas sp. 2012CJ34-2]|uniref:5'-nucleotidase C-terminal domain-containing protein n=1 Tax=Parendozoicomonas callyspongiae TaxID=2942213 RepID=A0ABT0PG21_9GAMM|nr:metallophosphoesterase [Sansalvadorimonas sp. 2012CJ34-2]MCL6270327.1 5'-nucleotidase C-terminal domain-containing protein [Sansalvadorimonas sp. 2012CJ34-2]